MKNLMLIMLFAVVAALAPVSMSWAAAEEAAVGSVVAVRGEATAVDRQGAMRALALKTPVFRQETIRTGKGGRVQLLFRDNSIVSLGENSVLVIAEYDWDAQKQTGTMKTRVEEGVFRVLGGMISKTSPKNFTTETPAATIGIRGSMYAGSYRQDRLQVVFLGGTGIFVSNSYGRVEIDRPGYGTWVILGQAPQEPVKMDPREVAGVLEGLGSGGDLPPGGSPLAPEFAELLGNGIPGDFAADPAVVTASELAEEVTETHSNDRIRVIDHDPKDKDKEEVSVPKAFDDTFSTAEDTPMLIEPRAILSNDNDGENGTPVFDGIVLPPGNGQLTSNGGGTLYYRPNENYSGTDSFVYRVVDNRGASSQATVSITVTPVNDFPVGADGSISANEDSAVSGAIGFSDIDSTSLSVTPTNPSHGSLTWSADGSFVYTPNPDFNGTDSFNYTVSDDSGGTDTGTITITVAAMPEMLAITGKVQAFMRNMNNGELVEVTQSEVATSVATPSEPAGAYSSYDEEISGETVTVESETGEFSTTRDVSWDNKDEFFVARYNSAGNIVSVGGGDYRYQSLVFGGVPTPESSLPSAGIGTYDGQFLGARLVPCLDCDTSEIFPTTMYVNWSNRKVFGMFREPELSLATLAIGGPSGPYPGNHLYYYGDYDASPANVQFVSGDGWSGSNVMPGEIHTIAGTATFLQFYGSEYQGIGLVANGVESAVDDMAAGDPWQGVAGMFREPGLPEVSPLGVETLSGFYVAQVDYVGVPTSSSLWLGDDLSLTVDAVQGTVSGSLGNYQLGGAGNSAYVGNDRFIAGFVPGNGVQAQGGFLVTAAPSWQFSDYVSWGYWNQVVETVDGGEVYHVHSPGSLWVAGEATPLADLQNLVTAYMTGTYEGPAYGIKIDSMNNAIPLTNGHTSLTFAFGQYSISGEIRADQGTVPINASYGWSGGTVGNFEATQTPIIGIDVLVGAPVEPMNTVSVTGGFFGPNAHTLAGSFKANIAGDGRYSGIFMGEQTSLVPNVPGVAVP